MHSSIYNRVPPQILRHLVIPEDTVIAFLLPPFGITPIGITDIYPIGQMTHDLDIDNFDLEHMYHQLEILSNQDLEKLIVLHYEKWPMELFDRLGGIIPDFEIIETEKPNGILQELFGK